MVVSTLVHYFCELIFSSVIGPIVSQISESYEINVFTKLSSWIFNFCNKNT